MYATGRRRRYVYNFQIYPHMPCYKYYINVNVFDTDSEMYGYYQKKEGMEKDFEAIYYDCVCEGNKIGEILIHKKALTPKIISHECGHATTRYLTRLCVNNKKRAIHDIENDEFYCAVLGCLVGQFTKLAIINN